MKCRCKSKEVFVCPDKYNCDKNPVFKPMNIKHTKCCYCRRTFNDEEENLKRTKDHFIPTSRTGTGSENVLECCQECNLWKADKMPDFWLNRVLYLEDKRSLYGSYTLFDYRQIIGSIKHWMKFFKGKKISAYKY